MSAARRLPGTLETKAGRLAGYNPQDPPARLRYAALEKLLTHDLPGEEAEDWRAMLRRAVWQDDIDCRHTGTLTHEGTIERRPLDAAALRRALAGIRYFKGLGPRPDHPPLDSENPGKAPQYPQNPPFVTVDVDGPFDDIGPTGYGLSIGTLDGDDAQVHIETEFRAASVRDWLHTLTEPSEPTPVLWAWINATTPRPTHIGYDELVTLGFPTAPESYAPYILKLDGLYAVAPDAPGDLSYAERRALHPDGTDYAAAVLGIPCGIPEFMKFLDAAGLWDAVGYPNQAYAPTWAALGLPTPDAIATLLAKAKDGHEPSGDKSETRTPRRFTQDRAEKLAAVLDEIENRAREVGHPFARAEWPGTKVELREFLCWKDRRLHNLPEDMDKFTDVLPDGIKFLPGNNKGKGLRFYKKLFPDYCPK